jgi:hypothetical protein
MEWVGRCEGDWAGQARFKEKIPLGIDFQFLMDFGICQDI